jgi:hypothetical protein
MISRMNSIFKIRIFFKIFEKNSANKVLFILGFTFENSKDKKISNLKRKDEKK